MDRRKNDREPGAQTRSFEKLSLLTAAVSGLREDLTAYRWTLDRYLKRGAIGLGILLLLVALLVTSTVATVLTARNNDLLLDSIAESEERHREDVQNHRVRNELLHSCIVDLILAVVESDPEDRSDVINPCPEEINGG